MPSVRIDIDGLSHDGRGLARIAGKVAFVEGALPGEQVDAVLTRRHARFEEYRTVDVVTAAAERATPPCPLAARCGGCDLQHVEPAAQLVRKTAAVLDLLERQARLVPEQLAEPLRSAPFGYRRRARLAVSMARRGGQVTVGFREAGGTSLVAVDHCLVLEPVIQPMPGQLQAVLARFRRPRKVGHLELMVSEAADGARDPVIHLHCAAAPDEDDLAALAELAAAEGAYLTVRAADTPLRSLHRPRCEHTGYRLPEFALHLGYEPGDFLQGNAEVNRRLVSQAVAWLEPYRPGPLLDAFCGIGNFSLPLARSGFEVRGLESVPAMVARARDNAVANGLAEQATFAVHDLEAEPSLQRGRFAAALLDPPRSGARTLIQVLADRRVEVILYVSCAPPTLARDAALLAAAGYRLARLGLVDMFPQTRHIETMALFTRSASRKRR